MIIVSSTGEGVRLALRRYRPGEAEHPGRLMTIGVVELPNGRRTQFELPLFTPADAAALGTWLRAASSGELAAGARTAFDFSEVAFELLGYEGDEADLRVHFAGPCALTWADDEKFGGPLKLLVRDDALEIAAGHWERELAKATS